MPKIKIKNLSAEINRRIKLIKTPTSVVDIGQQQGAVVNQSDYVGICLAPSSSDILGCEGAVDHITVGTITDGGIINVYLNDQLLDASEIFFFRNGGASDLLRQAGIQVTPLTSSGLPATDSGGGRYYDAEQARFVNTNPTYQKIRIELIDASSVSENHTPENESFEYNPETRSTSFCLSPQSNQISCDGATPQLSLADCRGIWDFYLNGEFILRGLPGDISLWVLTNKQGELWADWDGPLVFVLKDLTKTFRFRMVPSESATYRPPTDIEDNPTFIEHDDGSLTFCLSGSTIPIGCAGATPSADTGGIWGNVTMTVNGTPHESIESIPDVLRLERDGELHFIFTNLSDQYLRVHITSTGLNQNDYGWNENQNPTRGVDFEAGTIDFCLSPSPLVSITGWYTQIPTSQVNLEGLSLSVDIDGQSWGDLVYSNGVDETRNGTWDDVPFIVGISPDGLYLRSIGSLNMNNIQISSPNIEFTNPPTDYNGPEESTYTITGTGLGNIARTSLLEYVGNEVTGNTVYLNAAWVTTYPFTVGTTQYLEGTNTGAYHVGASVGRTVAHESVAAAADWYQNTTFGWLNGQTIPQATGMQFSDDGSGNLRIYNTNSHEVTLYLTQSSGQFGGALNAESDGMASVRYRDGNNIALRLSGSPF